MSDERYLPLTRQIHQGLEQIRREMFGSLLQHFLPVVASCCHYRCVHKRPLGMDCIVYFIEGGISRCVLPSADAPHAPSADTEFHLEKSWLPEKNHACRTLSPTKDMKCHMLSAASGQTQCWQQHCWLFSEIWKERSAVEPVRPGRC